MMVINDNIYFSQKKISCDVFKIQVNLCTSIRRIEFKALNRTFIIDVHENSRLTSKSYFEKFHNESINIKTFINDIEKSKYCHFHGHFNDKVNSLVALSTYNGTLNGMLSDEKDAYFIHYDIGEKHHLFFQGSNYLNHNDLKCGVDNAKISLKRFTRAIHESSVSAKEPYKSNFRSRYVELVIVNDYQEFVDNARNKKLVIERSKQIANIVNALYNPLNIYIALVGIVVWSYHNEIVMDKDGDTTLNNFLRYRRERLIPEFPNDNAQLITGISFTGGVVGKALKGPICTYEFSGGVNTDHSHIVGLVATTVAHELGHNFGMEHDSEKCKCPENKCIMAPSSSSISPKNWSECSIDYLNEAFAKGMDHCLRNLPEHIIGPICGNGFIEEGEECDCGLKQYCDSRCCNASTCKLVAGAKCATGSCCDTNTCEFRSSSFMCRPASNECDLSEYCSGESEFCPEDVYAFDGMECAKGSAHCYEGACFSHYLQCKRIWGPSGDVSDKRCFQQNTKGNANGNCGYNRVNSTYTACASENILCGMLHCTHQTEKLELGIDSAALLPYSFLTINKNITHTCRSAIIDLGLEIRDPGLVPNGAKCGNERMCVNQQCVPVKSITATMKCSDHCNYNGVCDNLGKCHCFDGFAAPNCEFTIPKGYHLTFAIYIIFLCILPLTSFTIFVAFYFKEHIKSWWAIRARKSVIKARAKDISTSRNHPRPPSGRFDLRSVEISEPIPLDASEEPSLTNNQFRNSVSFSRNTTTPVQITSPNDLCQPKHSLVIDVKKPIRPAPPPPPSSSAVTATTNISLQSPPPVNPNTSHQNRPLSRTSSTRSSSRRPTSLLASRPSCPPPEPPKLPTQNSLDKIEKISDSAYESNKGDECSLLNDNETITKPSIAQTILAFHSSPTSRSKYAPLDNTTRPSKPPKPRLKTGAKVESLAQMFEQK